MMLLHVQNMPILEQLELEEALLRTDERNFCIINEDLLTVDTHRIGEIQVLMTIVGGKIVFDQLFKEDT